MYISKHKFLLDIIKREIMPATGCTEPVAVAYSVAAAREQIGGSLVSLKVSVNPGLYKNGMNVGIPGTPERGLIIAAALGFVIGKTEKGLRMLEGLTDEQVDEARDIIRDKKVSVQIEDGCDRLYIETIMTTLEGSVRVVTLDRHQNIVSVEKGHKFKTVDPLKNQLESTSRQIEDYDFGDFLKFADEVPASELLFLKDGVEMNLRVAAAGLKMEGCSGAILEKMIRAGILPDNMVFYTQMLCAAASEARMSGVKMPVMSCTGSGNHGITVFLINAAVARKKGIPEERLLRALALSILITIYIKSHTGALSAMCGCGVAAGIGGSVGVVYLLNGNQDMMYGALLNMVGSISGIICDGGKEGCSHKLMLASGWAVEAALLSMNGAVINPCDGILAPDFKTLIQNLGYICSPGMLSTNKTILEIMQGL